MTNPPPCHAQVNKRVAKEELTDLSGDRLFPKVQWPPPDLCPLCRAPSLATAAASESTALEPEWNEDEVFHFLLRFYGDEARRESAAQEFGGGRCCSSVSSSCDVLTPLDPSHLPMSRTAGACRWQLMLALKLLSTIESVIKSRISLASVFLSLSLSCERAPRRSTTTVLFTVRARQHCLH